MKIADKVRALMEHTGWGQAEIGRRLSTSQSTVFRWLAGSEPEGHRRDQINELYETYVVGGSVSQVPLKGFIGAGHFIEALDGAPEFVEAPAGAPQTTVAAEIRGDSQLPILQDGWIIYWSKLMSPEAMLNKLAVVQLADERIMVKTIRRGSEDGLWTLTSANAADLVDVPVEWAAPIDWIKPR